MAEERATSRAPLEPLNLLVVSFGGPGDVYPMLGFATALRDRGHRVRFSANAHYAALAEHYGLEFIGSPLPRIIPEARVPSRPLRRAQEVFTRSWLYQSVSRQGMRTRRYLARMRWLYELVANEPDPRRTVVVTPVNSFGARIAQEKLGAGLVTVQLQPAGFRSACDAPGLPLPASAGRMVRSALWSAIDCYFELTITPSLNRFRSELGLPFVHRPFRRWVYSPDLVIGLFPDWFAPPQPDWPPNAHTTGFALFDESGNRQAPPELESFLKSGEFPIVFTRGSQSRGERTFFETSIEICRRLKRRGLLLARHSSSIPKSLPETVRHFEYVPLSAVLPRACAIVHHGGVGTTALALAAGVPQLAVPLFDDQPDNAARVQRLGAGFRLTPRAYRAGLASRRLQDLLDSQDVAATCRSLAARMQGPNPLAEACRLIESRWGP